MESINVYSSDAVINGSYPRQWLVKNKAESDFPYLCHRSSLSAVSPYNIEREVNYYQYTMACCNNYYFKNEEWGHSKTHTQQGKH